MLYSDPGVARLQNKNILLQTNKSMKPQMLLEMPNTFHCRKGIYLIYYDLSLALALSLYNYTYLVAIKGL